jgi:hypothetical protein
VEARSIEPETAHPQLPEVARAEREDAERLRSTLAALPTEQQTALELAYWAGLSQTEIGARIGQPLGTVKTRVRLGLLRLAKLLEDYPTAKHDRSERRAMIDKQTKAGLKSAMPIRTPPEQIVEPSDSGRIRTPNSQTTLEPCVEGGTLTRRLGP